jgi:hypothetical protein
VPDLEISSGVAYRRAREIRNLETRLLEVRIRQLQNLARSGHMDECQRENIIELMKKLAQMKASGRYLR